jgi:hemerythrin-like metal-binding protein
MAKSEPPLPTGILEQHGHIATLIGELHTAHDAGVAWDELAHKLDRVLEDVRGHFEHEEAEMAKAGYPKLDEHQSAHNTFLRRLLVLRRECDRRETELMGMFIELLENWFKNHERTADAQVLKFLRIDPKS